MTIFVFNPQNKNPLFWDTVSILYRNIDIALDQVEDVNVFKEGSRQRTVVRNVFIFLWRFLAF